MALRKTILGVESLELGASSLFRKLFGKSGHARPALPRRRLEVEGLEERMVPTVVFQNAFGPETISAGALQNAMQSPPVYLVFWGSDWNTQAGAQYKNALVKTAQSFIGSGAFEGLKQYGGDGKASWGGSWVDPTDPPPSAAIKGSDVNAVLQKAIDDPSSPLPDPSALAHKPIYFVVTPPTAANMGGGGWNGGGSYVHNGAVTPIHQGLLRTMPGNKDSFSILLSHELIESMSNSGGVHFPANLPDNLQGDDQISDNEPNGAYVERFANGALGQAYWSKQDANYIMTDGNTQKINLTPIWTVNAANTIADLNGFDLIVNGDQRANLNDSIILDQTDQGGVKVTLNGETTIFDPNQIKSITINAGKGNDTIEVRATPANVSTKVNAGDGVDTMLAGAPGQSFGAYHTLSYIQGDVLFDGGNDIDTLTVNDNDIFDTARTYDLQFMSLSRPGSANITYDHVSSVTVNAGGGNDSFKVNDHNLFVQIYLNGGLGQDAITGPNRNDLWIISGANQGSFDGQIHFTGAESLVGGAANDTYRFLPAGTLTGAVFGGLGADTLDYSMQVAAVSVVLATNHATAMTSAFSGIEAFVGGSSSADQITGTFIGATWTFDVNNMLSDGAITATSFERLFAGPGNDTLIGTNFVNEFDVTNFNTGSLNTKLSFQGIENLQGSVGSDLFKFSPAGNISGKVDGGAGIDTLDFSASMNAVNVNLANGTATGMQSIQHVENVIGGAGNDTLVGDNGNNTLKGNLGNDILAGLGGGDVLIGDAGDDQLLGGDGRDILIGGLGKDVLSGGNDEDIVIGGFTKFDNNNLFALFAMSNEWQRTDLTYDQRYNELKVTGVMGQYRFDAQSVFADSDIDHVFGNSGDDWFWATPNQDVTDRGLASSGSPEKLN